jgi:hypothetical protein
MQVSLSTTTLPLGRSRGPGSAITTGPGRFSPAARRLDGGRIVNAYWHARGRRIRDLPITPDKYVREL